MQPFGPGCLFIGNCLITAFSFVACSWFVDIFWFFLIQPWKILCFLEFIHSRLSNSLAYSCSWYFLLILCMSVLSVDTSLSFLILFGFSFFMRNLDEGLSILFIFSKNQLLVSLIFSIICFDYFIYFHSDLYYFLPFVTLDFLVCSFSSSLGVR